LQRRGPGGRDAPRRRPLRADGNQHRAGHDQPLAGAEGGRAAGHRLRRAVLADPGGDAVSALLRTLVWMLALAVVALPVVAVLEGWIGADRWPLSTLRVTGELVHVPDQRLREAVLPHVQQGFF